jgi:cyanophycinase
MAAVSVLQGLPSARADQTQEAPKIKGALVIAGGELRFDNAAVWKRFVDLAGGEGARVVVVPAASRNPKASGQAVVENLRRYGAQATLVPIAPRLEDVDYKAAAADPANVQKLREAHGVWFIGGAQQRITQALLKDDKDRTMTPALDAIWQAYRDGAVIGGSSAGAAIMSQSMFANPKESLATLKYGIEEGEVDRGLGFLGDQWFVDQHFLTRGRFGRAIRAMQYLGLTHGIGIDEDTALVFQDGQFEVIGYKGALVLDLSAVQTEKEQPEFNLKKVRLTYLDTGDKMDARTRVIRVSERKQRGQKIDPSSKDFNPYYNRPKGIPDLFSAWAIYEAMTHALDSKTGVVKGMALDPWDERSKKDLGFEFMVYRDTDTDGWYTSQGGYQTYTIRNVYLDVTPIRQANPLFHPIEPSAVKPDSQE